MSRHVPPHNLSAEQAVLGDILMDNSALPDVQELLPPDDFYSHPHREIYRACLSLADSGRPADIVTVAEALGSRLSDVGGAVYLSDLAEGAAGASNAVHHARIVKDFSLRRKLIDIGSGLITAGMEPIESQARELAVNNMAADLETIRHTDDVSNGIFTPADLGERLQDFYNNGASPGISSGWPSLDPYYTIRLRETTYITGIPAHGKSTFMDGLMVNLWMQHGWRWCVYSPENHPVERHLSSLIEKVAGRPFSRCGRFGDPRMDPADVEEVRASMGRDFQFIELPERIAPTLDIILSFFRQAAEQGCTGFVVDPWNELDHSRPSSLSETEYISMCLSKIRRFARAYDIHVWVVAHPTKLQKNKEGDYPIPTLYDISGSAHWYNKAINGLVVHRPDYTVARVDIHSVKIKFREVGILGRATLNFIMDTGTFQEPRR